MANRKDTRSYGDAATSTFDKVGGDEVQMASVAGASGAPSPNTVRFPRDDSAVTASSPGPAPGHRMTMLITGSTTGPDLGDLVEHSAARAARYLSARRQAGQSSTGPLDRSYFDHLFGLNLPGRGRA